MAMQTGVDRLVKLLQERQQLTVDEAAAALDIEKHTIESWADILREEGLIDIRYGISHTHLIRRDAPRPPGPDLHETFLSKVASAIHQIESDTADFEVFKQEFSALKQSLGNDFQQLHEELALVGNYSEMLRKLNGEIEARQTIFEQRQKEVQSALRSDRSEYQRVLQMLEDEQRQFKERQKKLAELTENITKEEQELGKERQRLEQLQKTADSFHTNLMLLARNQIEPLQRLSEGSVEELEELKQLHDTITKAQQPSPERQRILAFAQRSGEFEQLIQEIDSEKQQLLASLRDVREHAHSKGTQIPVQQLEGALLALDERRVLLKQKLATLHATIQHDSKRAREAPMLTVDPEHAKISAPEHGEIVCRFNAYYNPKARPVVHAHLEVTAGTRAQPFTYSIGTERWEEIGIHVLRSPLVNSDGAVIFDVHIGKGMPEAWGLFTVLPQLDVVTLTFTVMLHERATGKQLLVKTAETRIEKSMAANRPATQ